MTSVVRRLYSLLPRTAASHAGLMFVRAFVLSFALTCLSTPVQAGWTGCAKAETSAVVPEEGGKWLLYNGAIFTADSRFTHPRAVGVENGVIVAVGDEEDVLAALGGEARRVDLGGNFLMPGLVDSHVHVGFAGFQLTAESFPENLENAEQVRSFVWNAAAEHKAYLEDVLLFMNVPLSYWENPAMLGEALNGGEFAERPIILAGSDAHTGWCNRAMLRRAGLDEKSADTLPPAVRESFGRKADGSLNGFVCEGAWDEVLKHAPAVPEEKIDGAILAGAEVMHSYGFTAWMDPIANIRPLSPIFNAAPGKNDAGLLPAYTRLLKSGALNAHVSALLLAKLDSDASIVDEILDVKQRFDGLPELRIMGVKLLQDGVIEFPSQTAKLTRPYVGRPGYDGPRNIDPARYGELVAAIDAAGLSAHAHVIGDRAVREALDAVAHARKVNGESGVRHSMTHLEVVQPEDMPRFRALGVDCSMQFLWSGKAPSTSSLLEGSVPPELLGSLYPAQSLIRQGALVAGASDWPVSTPDPFLAMFSAVTRIGPEGFLPPESELISRDDALRAYTINAARLIGRGSESGSITPGKKADFVLLDRNLETVPAEAIPETRVLWTMFGGRLIYQGE